jgi:hypothetical protein
LDLATRIKVDLTRTNQHGFKKGRSTATAAFTIQSLIGRALNSNNYYVLASLNLILAFDMVDRPLLHKKWRPLAHLM